MVLFLNTRTNPARTPNPAIRAQPGWATEWRGMDVRSPSSRQQSKETGFVAAPMKLSKSDSAEFPSRKSEQCPRPRKKIVAGEVNASGSERADNPEKSPTIRAVRKWENPDTGAQKIPASVANAFSVRIVRAGAGERARADARASGRAGEPILDATQPRQYCRGWVGWGWGWN